VLVKEARSIVADDDVASTTLKKYLGLPYKRSHLVACSADGENLC